MKKVSDDFSIKEFVGLAFVPALVGLALSFGLVMVAAVQSPIKPQTNAANGCTTDKLKTAQGCEIASIMGNPENKIKRRLEEKDGKFTTINEVNFGGMVFTFKGKIGGANDVKDAEAANNAKSVISSVGGIFGTIVVDIIALLFIWMAFMAAKGVSRVVDAAAKPFQEMGEKIGKMGASLPKYTPIPGIGMSASSMGKVAAMPEQFLNQRASESTKGIEEKMAQAFGARLPYGTGDRATLKSKVSGSAGGLDAGNHQEFYNQAKAIGAKIGDIGTSNAQEFARDIHGILKNTDDAILRRYNLSKEKLEKMTPDVAAAQFIAGESKIIKSELDAKEYFKKLKDGSASTSSGGAPNNSSIGGVTENKINNNFKMNILGTSIQFSNNGDSIDRFQNIAELKNKKDSITEADFRTSVIGELGENKTKALIEAIKKDAPEFFKKA